MDNLMAAITLTVVGDIAFSGPFSTDPMGIARHIAADIRDLIRSEIVLADLECPLYDGPAETHDSLALVSPASAIEAIDALGVNAVSLANNHILDGGTAGLESTLRILEEHGVAHCGAGLNAEQAAQPALVKTPGGIVGLLGFYGGAVATPRRPGTLPLGGSPTTKIIRHARKQCDFLVVYFHGGIEAFNYPFRSIMRECHRAVDNGASLVVGTHPHTIQGIEWYKGVPIAYSLGNFILPMALPDRYENWRRQTGLTRLGIPFDKKVIMRALVLKCRFHPGGKVDAEGTPIFVDETGLPRLPRPDETNEAKAFFQALCEVFLHPDDPSWRQRDKVEKGFFRLLKSQVDFGYILRNLNLVRWRHFIALLRLVRRSW